MYTRGYGPGRYGHGYGLSQGARYGHALGPYGRGGLFRGNLGHRGDGYGYNQHLSRYGGYGNGYGINRYGNTPIYTSYNKY